MNTKKIYTYEIKVINQIAIVKDPDTGEVVFEMPIYDSEGLKDQLKLQLEMMPDNRNKEIGLVEVRYKCDF